MPELISANSGAAGGCAWVTAEMLSVCRCGCASMFCELIWGGVYCLLNVSELPIRNIGNTWYSRLWKWHCLLILALLNHQIQLISKLNMSKTTAQIKLDYKFYSYHSIYKVLCNKDLNGLESLLPRDVEAHCGWLHLAQQYAEMFEVGLPYFSCQHIVQ